MSSTQLLAANGNSVTYADPLNPNFTVRFKSTKTRKAVNGVPADNYVTEIIVNDLNNVGSGEAAFVDTVSTRVRISGSDKSMVRLKAILGSLAAQIPDWADENVLLGFRPQTVPINP